MDWKFRASVALDDHRLRLNMFQCGSVNGFVKDSAKLSVNRESVADDFVRHLTKLVLGHLPQWEENVYRHGCRWRKGEKMEK